MGDRYHIKIECAWCGELNPKPVKDSEHWQDNYLCYTESSGLTEFRCDYCGKLNGIAMVFEAFKKKEKNPVIGEQTGQSEQESLKTN